MEEGYTVSGLAVIDHDRFFKQYNDTYGHQAGDDCLKQVASVLSETVSRSTDLVARYGGEEFSVILTNTEVKGAANVAEKLRIEVEALGITHKKSKVSEHVTISIGVATNIPNKDFPPESLIAAADKALYRAKQEGRNRIRKSEDIVPI